MVKDEGGHYKSRKDGEKKKSQLNCSTSAIVQMGKSSKDVRLHQILIFFTQKSDKYPSSFYAKILIQTNKHWTFLWFTWFSCFNFFIKKKNTNKQKVPSKRENKHQHNRKGWVSDGVCLSIFIFISFFQKLFANHINYLDKFNSRAHRKDSFSY